MRARIQSSKTLTARLAVVAVLSTAVVNPVTSPAATPPGPADLPKSYLFTAAGTMTPLHPGRTYEASEFPFPIRVTPPDAGWAGTQWRSGHDYFRGGGPPNFGWVHLSRGSTGGVPRGLISVMSPYAATPSVASTVNVLRSRGRGAEYEPVSPVTVAGFHGRMFDGRIVGAKNRDHIGHYFVPFAPPSHGSHYYPDEYPVYGDVFRVIVLSVRHKTVVIYIENCALPEEQFPAFLTKTGHVLASIRFPRHSHDG